MFASPVLAADIDRAEGRLCAAVAREVGARQPDRGCFVIDCAGGVAAYAGLGAPASKLIGLGFDIVVDEAALDQVERAFADRRAPVQAEVATLAQPDLVTLLSDRGYAFRGFEHVLGRPLRGDLAPGPRDVLVERVLAENVPRWIDVLMEGFEHPEAGGTGRGAAPSQPLLRDWLEATVGVPGFRLYLARIGETLAGGAALRIDGALAQLSGAATLPGYRRRGVQTALLRARLGDAAHLGCSLAVVTTQPGSKPQENVQREGFALLYARALLVKPAP